MGSFNIIKKNRTNSFIIYVNKLELWFLYYENGFKSEFNILYTWLMITSNLCSALFVIILPKWDSFWSFLIFRKVMYGNNA